MKKFNVIQRKAKQVFLNEQQRVVDNEKSLLLEAIKKNYNINDFSEINEKEKASFRTMISKMWDAKSGLNKVGHKFINESKQILTKDSTPEQIEKFFKKKIKANASKCVASLIKGEACPLVSNLKSDVEEMIERPLSDAKCKKWIFDVCGKFLGENLKETTL